jgi:hypothetical protein
MSVLKIPTAKIFEPLLEPSRYKGVFGGRGSGKSHFFGELLVETCQAERGTLAVCIREAQRTLAQSSKRLIESKITALGLGHRFKVFIDKIETPGDGIIIFRGMQVRVLDYYESVGQVLAFHVNWLRSNGYAQAILHLPHDGVAANNITGKRYEDHLREAGFAVEPPVKNQGKGAAMMRIEALRRLGSQLWFNETTTEPGRDAIGFYHERKDDARNVGLGPEHDWSSHAADALGLMAICYEQPGRTGSFNRPIRYGDQGWA